MEQRETVSGFSELKDLLIRTYQIEKSREFVRLFFSESDGALIMHDFDDHNKTIHLCFDIKKRSIQKNLTNNAKQLVIESLDQPSPSQYLIDEFQLYGFFRV
jgi:hypothetical protein